MSTETTTAVEKKESLFSKKNRKLLTDPLDDSNPITVQVLGIVPPSPSRCRCSRPSSCPSPCSS